MSDLTSPNDPDQWQEEWLEAVGDLAAVLRKLEKGNPYPDSPLLPQAMNYLMTELWDRCFSQTEIRQAFLDAVEDIPRYAAGHEVRP